MNKFEIEITLGFNQSAERVLLSLIEALKEPSTCLTLSADDIKALDEVLASSKELKQKADIADGKSSSSSSSLQQT